MEEINKKINEIKSELAPEEEHVDVMDQMQKIGEKWTEFKKTWVAHFKDMDFEVKEWNFGVGKNGEEYILDMKAKVTVKPRKSTPTLAPQ